MSRNDIAKGIANELFDFDMLDLHNFSGDTKALIDCTQEIILKHLQDYIIVSGRILEND